MCCEIRIVAPYTKIYIENKHIYYYPVILEINKNLKILKGSRGHNKK